MYSGNKLEDEEGFVRFSGDYFNNEIGLPAA